jgi:hypothetical protein
VKVVDDVILKLPPTRYVPGGRVAEVTTVVAPFPAVTLVEVFTRIGGANAFTAVGATLYIETPMVAICLSAIKVMVLISSLNTNAA